MHHIVWIIGALMALGGIAMVLKPDWMKRMMEFFNVRHRFQAAAAIKLIIGVIFLIFARDFRHWQVLAAIGILTAAGNLWALLIKPETALKFMLWWQKKPFWVYRLWGVSATMLGGIIIYIGSIPA
ncbi:MAG: hypothetical protein GXY41_07865 [Phycisphaerae bacterium]|jgi:uncharacterized membrane protein|nr:hypothetical protein [Phycisphaerae bacterium]